MRFSIKKVHVLTAAPAFLLAHLMGAVVVEGSLDGGCRVWTACLYAQAVRTPQSALASAFPGAHVDRVPLYLTVPEKSDLEKELGFALDGRFYTFYTARSQGKLQGIGTFDTHKVRTKEETLFIVIDAAGFIQTVEVVSFFEPEEYNPTERWLRLFLGKKQGDGLRPGSEIPTMAGATLTTMAVSRAVKRTLALERILRAHGGARAIEPDARTGAVRKQGPGHSV